MNSTRIGDIGVSYCITRCLEKNIPVYKPVSDNEKADLIILLDNIPKKIQVKSAIKDKNGKAEFNIKSSTSAIYNRKSKVHHYTKEEIDYYMLCNIARKEVYLVPFEEAKKNMVTLRYDNPKNNQKKNVKFAKNYIF